MLERPVAGRVFWTLGDGPTQQDLRLKAKALEIAFKAQILLDEEIVASASYFYESDLTRALLTGPGRGLVKDGELRLFVGSDLAGFEEHALEKARKSPASMAEYRHPGRLLRLSRQLDLLTQPLFRRHVDISGSIVQLWRDDSRKEHAGSLGALARELDGTEDGPTCALLLKIADDRQGDFVWPFVEPLLRSNGFPEDRLQNVKVALNRFYAKASSAAVDAALDLVDETSPEAHITRDGAHDPFLLLREFRALGLLGDLARLTIDQVRLLKRSAGWTAYHLLHDSLVGAAADLNRDASGAVLVLRHAQNAGITRQEFAQALANALRQRLDFWTLERCATLSETLLRLVDVFGDNPIVLLESAMREEPTRMNLRSTHPTTPLAFIVHGHDDELRLDLKNYIQNTLRWQEPVVLAERPSGGRTIIEKFEKHADAADYAFVLLSGDDVTGEDESRARQNVVFELGYFVGTLGRKSGRVLLLRKGNVRLPGDLDGVIYIDVSNGIAAAGEQIRAELGAR